MMDLNRPPLGLGTIEEEWLLSTGTTTTDVFSRVVGRQLLQETLRSSAAGDGFSGRRDLPDGFLLRSCIGVGRWTWLSAQPELVPLGVAVADPKRCRSSVSSLSFPSWICQI